MIAKEGAMSVPKPATRQRWKRRAEARPDEILAAALDEFIAKGFDAARIEDVARAAGLSKGAIYLYFPSKEALLRALVEREIAPLVTQLAAAAAAETADPVDMLRFALSYAATRIRDPRIFAIPRLVISISGRFPEITRHYRAAVVEPAHQIVERLIARGIALGRFRPVDLKAATRAIIGPMMFEALWTHVLEGESALGSAEDLVRTQIDLLIHGLGAETRP
jgi:AcrR family transcriptional regulator